MTSVCRDYKETREHNHRTTDQDHPEFQDQPDQKELEDSQVYQEREAQLEYQDSWDLLVSKVPRAHLVHLDSRVSQGHQACKG